MNRGKRGEYVQVDISWVRQCVSVKPYCHSSPRKSQTNKSNKYFSRVFVWFEKKNI